MIAAPSGRIERLPVWARVVLLILLLIAFLSGVKLMESSIKSVGEEQAKALFEGVQNPFAGLGVGILATVLVQSSSVTTALIVGLVGSGQLAVPTAVPMVMGANIGTSITNTLVSIGHVTRTAEFRRAFAGATMHDFFNLLTVLILLPLELIFGVLQRGAEALTHVFTFGGVSYDSPVKVFIGSIAKVGKRLVTDVVGLEGWPAAIVMCVLALGVIILALLTITRTMRSLMAARFEEALNRVLGKSGILAIIVGMLLTVAVQSSSITTSLLIPLIGAGVLTLEVAFPITLGANLGTTITAILAAMAADQSAGLTIALVHLLFNLAGVGLFYPTPFLRRLPLRLSRGLADLASRNRAWIIVYIVVVFVLIPLTGILFFKA